MSNDDAGDEGALKLLQAAQAAARGEPLSGDVVEYLRPTGVMGTLSQMTLTEIMQMMDFGRKTARIDVYLKSTHGSVHVHDGQIVRATASATAQATTQYGEPAFHALCREPEGFFRIHYEREEVDRNVQRPTTFVLLDTLRVIDEAKAAAGITDAPAPAPPESDNAFDGIAADVASFMNDDAAALAPAPPRETGAHDEEGASTQKMPRYKCALTVDVDGVLSVCEDIGQGGAFIRADAPRERGSVVSLRLIASELCPEDIEVIANVMHTMDAATAAAHGRSPGMGLRFDDTMMAPGQQQRLRELVAGIASREPPIQAIQTTTAKPAPVAFAPPVATVAPVASMAATPTGTTDSRRLTLPGQSMLDELAEVDFLIATGDLKGAQAVLVTAREAHPDDVDVKRRLDDVNAQINAAQAMAFLQHAERHVSMSSAAPDAVESARRAIALRPMREVLLRALAVFWYAHSPNDIAETAARLLELDPEDEGALRTWLDANVELQRWNVALRAVEALLRRRPNDEQLKKLATRLVGLARKK